MDLIDSNGRLYSKMPKLPAELDKFREEYDSACMNLPSNIMNMMDAYHQIENLFMESRNRELTDEELYRLKFCMYVVTQTAGELVSSEKHIK